MKFESEQQLFDTALGCAGFDAFVLGPTKKYLVEPKGLFGIPDLVIVDVDCVRQPRQLFCALAFEMKLSNWKRAIVQAYRYRSFAEESYVMLDSANIRPALRNLHLFQKTNLGLLSIDSEGNLKEHYKPITKTPFCANLRTHLENIVFSSSNPSEYFTYI